MESKQKPEETLKVDAEAIRPQIEYFFNRLTTEQWELLKKGTPDSATKIYLADLLMDIITTLCKVVIMALQNKTAIVSKRRVETRLGKLLLQNFGQCLNLPEQVKSVSSKPLSDLVNTEVEEMVNSALCSNVSSIGSIISERITPPRTLNSMVVHAIKVLKDFMAKALCIPRRRRRKEKHLKEEKPLPIGKDESKEEDSLSDLSVKSVSLSVEKKLHAELSNVMESIMEDMPESSSETLRSEISQEIENASVDIAEEIVQNNLNQRAPKKKPKTFFKTVRNRIQAFFTSCFAKLSILRIIARLKKKFKLKSKGKRKQSMKPIMAKLECLAHSEKDQEGKEVSMLPLIRNGDNVLIFMQELSDLLYTNLTGERMPYIVPESLLVARDNTHSVISSKVWSFIAMLNWWYNTQVGSHSKRAAQALLTTTAETYKEPVKSKETQLHPDLNERRNKASVRLLTEKIAWRLFRKLEMVPKNKDDIMERLFENTWAAVEGSEMYITQDTFMSHKKIVKDLCKQWGDADTVLIALNMKDPLIGKCLASSVGRILTRSPKKPGALRRSFSSLSKVMSKPFRGKRLG